MLTKRQVIAARRCAIENVASAFLPVEQGADSTAAAASRCVAALIDQRAICGLHPTAASDAIRLVHEGSVLAFEAQARFRQAHELLAELPAALFGTTSYVPDCPPNEGVQRDEVTLYAVQAA